MQLKNVGQDTVKGYGQSLKSGNCSGASSGHVSAGRWDGRRHFHRCGSLLRTQSRAEQRPHHHHVLSCFDGSHMVWQTDSADNEHWKMKVKAHPDWSMAFFPLTVESEETHMGTFTLIILSHKHTTSIVRSTITADQQPRGLWPPHCPPICQHN